VTRERERGEKREEKQERRERRPKIGAGEIQR
jgi:hypothetical protein